MNKSTWLLLLLALVVGVSLTRLVVGSSDRSPEELLESIRVRLDEEDPPDFDRAFHELDLALSKVTSESDPELYADLLEHRAAALIRCRAGDSALGDLEHLIQLDTENETKWKLRIGDVHLAAGRYEEAVEIFDQILGEIPWHRFTHQQKARALQAMAEDGFEEFSRLLTDALPPRIAADRLALAERIVHSHPTDPFRAADLADLESQFNRDNSRSLRDARVMIPDLTAAFGAAREENVLATGDRVHGRVIEALTRDLLLTGRPTLAVDLGLASLTQELASKDPGSLQVLASALAAQGRPEAAADVIQAALPRTDEAKLGVDFLPHWGKILFEAQEWNRLLAVGSELRQSPKYLRDSRQRQDAGLFYSGIALVRIGKAREGDQLLRSYARADSAEPIPGARGRAWRELASLEKRSGRPEAEFEALRQATRLDPEGNGEAFRKLAEIRWERGDDAYVAAENMGHAIRLLPTRGDALESRWRQFGEAALIERGIDIDLSLNRLNEAGLSYPSENESAYVLLRLAERRLENSDLADALEIAEYLSGKMPDFLPALDVRLRILQALGRPEERIELLLRRLELAPGYKPVLNELRELWEAGELTSGQFLRLMQADPEATGRHTFVRQLIDRGRADLALRALGEPEAEEPRGNEAGSEPGGSEPGDSEPGDSEPGGEEISQAQADRPELARRAILLAAEAELELGRPHLCLGRLEAIPEGSPEHSAALRLAIDAALALRNGRLLEKTLQHFEQTSALDLTLAMAAGDELVRAGLNDPALQLFEFLDQHESAWLAEPEVPGESSPLDAVHSWDPTRGLIEAGSTVELGELRAQLLLRLALVHLIRGTPPSASAALQRAQAWFADGSADLGRMLLAIQTGGWTGLPGYASDLRDSEFVPTPLEGAVLAALEDRLDEADAQLAALELETTDPLVSLARLAVDALAGREILAPARFGPDGTRITRELLRGQPGVAKNRRDPRHTLALIVVLERSEWRLWLESSIPDAEFNPPGSMWLEYIAARSEQNAGEFAEAEVRLEKLLKLHPGFEPAWDLADALLLRRVERLDHPERIEQLAVRQVATGRAVGPAGEAPELRLARAVALERSGDLEGALNLALETNELYPGLLAARPVLARIARSLGRTPVTLDAYTSFFDRAESDLAESYVSEYLELWSELTAEGERTVGAERLEMESLALLLPSDPRIALRLAELDIASTPTNPRLGVARAFDRLGKFRATLAGEPLESDSAEAWLAFYLTYDPVEAERFVRELMESKPADLDLWLHLGRCFEAQGEYQSAIEWYESIRQMVPETRALRRIAEVLASLGSNHPEVERLVQQIRSLDRELPDLTRLEFMRGKSLVNSAFSNVDRGLTILGALWSRADVGEPFLTRGELGYVYASALVRAGSYEKKDLAVSILDKQIASSTDPLEVDGLRALRNLAEALSIPEPEPAEASEDEAAPSAQGAPK